MNTTIVHIDTDNDCQRLQLKMLFNEYSSALSTNIDTNIIEKLFKLPYFHGFICNVNDKPAAFAVCFESYSTYRSKKVLNIHDFMVASNYRSKGVGKVLLHGIEQYSRENNYLKITLEVSEGNIAAKKLYDSCHFEDEKITSTDLLHWQKYLD